MTPLKGRRLIADFVRHAPSDWAAPAQEAAAISVCDTLAVAFAAGETPIVRKIGRFLDRRRSANLPSNIWLGGDNASHEDAALFNAVSAHALDYDDVATAWRGHPTAVLLPALAALSSHKAARAGSLLDAYIVGFEVGAALGHGVIETHYPAGWHSTSTIGVIAATAACCRLLDLDRDVTEHALGLAVAQAAGTQANFGSEAKPMQAGFAASAAIRATLLAAQGVQSGDDIITGPAGFETLYSGGTTTAQHLTRLGEGSPSAMAGIEIKSFPTCFATHRALVAAEELQNSAGFSPETITVISVIGTPASHAPLRSTPPASADEAKFHMATCVALMLVHGRVGLAEFDSRAFLSPEVRRLADLIRVDEAVFDAPGRISRVSVTAGGETVAREVAMLPRVSWQNTAWRGKIADCLANCGPAHRAGWIGLASLYAGEEFSPAVRSLI